MLQGSQSPHPEPQHGHPPRSPPQSPSQRGQMRDCNFRRAFYFCSRHSQQGLSTPTLGQFSAPGGNDPKPTAILTRRPKKFANEEVNGKFDYNKMPLAPLGTKGLVYEDLTVRARWAPHGTDAYYDGLAL